jgi:hypothetical protein
VTGAPFEPDGSVDEPLGHSEIEQDYDERGRKAGQQSDAQPLSCRERITSR